MVIIFYLVGKILVFVGEHFPNPSIFGWHPLNFIQAGIKDTGQALVDVADLVIDPIVALFLTPVHLVTAVFQRITNAISYAHRKIATLFNDTIPAAQQAATTNANTYTQGQVANTEQRITDLQTNIDQQIADLKASLAAQIQSGAATAFAALDQQLLSRISGDEATMAAITTEIQTTLPDDIATQVNDAKAAEQQALTAQTAAINAQIAGLQSQIATATEDAQAAQTDITNAEQQLATLFSEGSTDEAQITALQQEVTTATDDYNNLVTTIDDLNNQITGISSTLGQVQAAQQLTTTNENGITGLGAVGLVAVVGAIVAKITSMQTYLDDCVVQTCDETKPTGLKPSLLALLALLTDAAEIAAMVEMIKNPVESADALAPSLDAVASGAIDTWNALLSL